MVNAAHLRGHVGLRSARVRRASRAIVCVSVLMSLVTLLSTAKRRRSGVLRRGCQASAPASLSLLRRAPLLTRYGVTHYLRASTRIVSVAWRKPDRRDTPVFWVK